METKKIRIGNDIRLAVDLRQYIGHNYLEERKVYSPGMEDFENIDSNPFVNKKYEVYWPNQYADKSGNAIEFEPEGSEISIRSVKAILINTSREAELVEEHKRKTRFIGRFPVEPFIEAFNATPYNVCCSGYPTWRAYPRAYHAMPYHGFGVHPEFGDIYKRIPFRNDTEYRALVYATKRQNVVEVSFPARAQRYTGTYKLVLVAEIYAPGFNHANLKTITVDMPDVFELVKTTEEGVDTGIAINVNQVIDILPGGETQPSVTYNDIYVNEGNLHGDNIDLGRTDGSTVTVDLSPITNWFEGD